MQINIRTSTWSRFDMCGDMSVSGMNKMVAIMQTTFFKHFFMTNKWIYFNSNFIEVCS